MLIQVPRVNGSLWSWWEWATAADIAGPATTRQIIESGRSVGLTHVVVAQRSPHLPVP
jgi:hypothetical protein